MTEREDELRPNKTEAYILNDSLRAILIGQTLLCFSFDLPPLSKAEA